jgi:hypothetical protein
MIAKKFGGIFLVLILTLAVFSVLSFGNAGTLAIKNSKEGAGMVQPLTRGATYNFNKTFTVQGGWDYTNLFAAAFVQDQTFTTKKDQSGNYNWKAAEVLQAYMDPLDGTTGTTGTDRYVLFELATGTWCGYCPAADGSFDRIVDDVNYFPSKCVPITWHNGDAYTTTDHDTRTTQYDIPGYPTAVFDGTIAKVGGGTTSTNTVCDQPYKNNIDNRRAVSSPLKITTKGHVDSSSGWINVTIEVVSTPSITDVEFYIVIVEDLDTTYAHGSDNVPLRHTARKTLFKQTMDIGNSAPSVSFSNSPNGKTFTDSMTVEWTASDLEDADSSLGIKLEYKQGAFTWNEIATTTNSGSYVWDISALEDGTDYKVRVTATDSQSAMNSVTSGTFTIDNPDPPTIAITSPVADDKVMGDLTITWDSSDPEDNRADLLVSLYYTSDGTNFNNIITDIVDSGSHVWDTTTVDDGTNYKLKAVVKDTTALTAEYVMFNTFTIDNMDNPLISFDTVLEGKTFSGDLVVTWTAEDDEDKSTEMKYSLYISSDSGTTWTAIFENSDYVSNHKLDTTQYANGDYMLKVVVTDTTSLTGEDVTNSPFTIKNNEPPVVTLTTPAEGKEYDSGIDITYTATDGQDALADLKVSFHRRRDLGTHCGRPDSGYQLSLGRHRSGQRGILPQDRGKGYHGRYGRGGFRDIHHQQQQTPGNNLALPQGWGDRTT